MLATAKLNQPVREAMNKVSPGGVSKRQSSPCFSAHTASHLLCQTSRAYDRSSSHASLHIPPVFARRGWPSLSPTIRTELPLVLTFASHPRPRISLAHDLAVAACPRA